MMAAQLSSLAMVWGSSGILRRVLRFLMQGIPLQGASFQGRVKESKRCKYDPLTTGTGTTTASPSAMRSLLDGMSSRPCAPGAHSRICRRRRSSQSKRWSFWQRRILIMGRLRDVHTQACWTGSRVLPSRDSTRLWLWGTNGSFQLQRRFVKHT